MIKGIFRFSVLELLTGTLVSAIFTLINLVPSYGHQEFTIYQTTFMQHVSRGWPMDYQQETAFDTVLPKNIDDDRTSETTAFKSRMATPRITSVTAFTANVVTLIAILVTLHVCICCTAKFRLRSRNAG